MKLAEIIGKQRFGISTTSVQLVVIIVQLIVINYIIPREA